ncbi:hypothetical protein ACRAWD_03885 [Caulobacter segnis]
MPKVGGGFLLKSATLHADARSSAGGADRQDHMTETIARWREFRTRGAGAARILRSFNTTALAEAQSAWFEARVRPIFAGRGHSGPMNRHRALILTASAAVLSACAPLRRQGLDWRPEPRPPAGTTTSSASTARNWA